MPTQRDEGNATWARAPTDGEEARRQTPEEAQQILLDRNERRTLEMARRLSRGARHLTWASAAGSKANSRPGEQERDPSWGRSQAEGQRAGLKLDAASASGRANSLTENREDVAASDGWTQGSSDAARAWRGTIAAGGRAGNDTGRCLRRPDQPRTRAGRTAAGG